MQRNNAFPRASRASLQRILFLSLLWLFFWQTPGETALPSWVTEVEKGLEEHLQGPLGLYYTNASDKHYLSETLTLRMELEALKKNKEGFDELCVYTEKYFLAPLGLLYWRLSPSGKPDEEDIANASIDDLRALRALHKAQSLWKDHRYKELFEALQEGVFMYNVRENLLLDGCHWKKRGLLNVQRIDPIKDHFTLSYGDLEILEKLAQKNPRWKRVYLETLGILAGGAANQKHLPWGYDFASQKFTRRDNNPINALLYMLSLMRIGIVPRKALEEYRQEFRLTGKIKDSQGMENIAMYALLAMVLQEGGYMDEAQKALDMLALFVLDTPGYQGLLGYAQKEKPFFEAWVFDNLLALIAAYSLEQNPFPKLTLSHDRIGLLP